MMPDRSELDQILQDALRDVNRAREALGYEPLTQLPQGVKNQSTACPIKNALPRAYQVTGISVMFSDRADATAVAQAWSSATTPMGGMWMVVAPDSVTDFVHDFDYGYFNEFIAPKNQ